MPRTRHPTSMRILTGPKTPSAMLVRDVMVRDVVTVDEGASVTETARLMSHRQISSIVVVRGGRLEGIATERDFIERVLAARKDPEKTKVSEIASTPVVDISPDLGVLEAVKIMKRHRFSQLPVTDAGTLVGIVALADLMAVLSTFFSATGGET